jgi:hypothetical protein
LFRTAGTKNIALFDMVNRNEWPARVSRRASLALVALRIAQPIRFGVQQGVQRLLHTPSHDPVEVVLDPLVANRDDIVQRARCSLWRLLLTDLVAFSHLQFSQIRGRQPYLFMPKIHYVISVHQRQGGRNRNGKH